MLKLPLKVARYSFQNFRCIINRLTVLNIVLLGFVPQIFSCFFFQFMSVLVTHRSGITIVNSGDSVEHFLVNKLYFLLKLFEFQWHKYLALLLYKMQYMLQHRLLINEVCNLFSSLSDLRTTGPW